MIRNYGLELKCSPYWELTDLVKLHDLFENLFYSLREYLCHVKLREQMVLIVKLITQVGLVHSNQASQPAPGE